MKKGISTIIVIAMITVLVGCIGVGTIVRGGYSVYLNDGTVFHNVKWYKSRTEGVGPFERPTGTVMFLTDEYGIVEVPWANVKIIKTPNVVR
jgi:hypothetical protein